MGTLHLTRHARRRKGCCRCWRPPRVCSGTTDAAAGSRPHSPKRHCRVAHGCNMALCNQLGQWDGKINIVPVPLRPISPAGCVHGLLFSLCSNLISTYNANWHNDKLITAAFLMRDIQPQAAAPCQQTKPTKKRLEGLANIESRALQNVHHPYYCLGRAGTFAHAPCSAFKRMT